MAKKIAKSPKSAERKMFVLDTNVLIYDPSSLFRFKKNDVYIPMVTLEELDANKSGSSDKARACRQASRLIAEAVEREGGGNMAEGFELSHYNGGHAVGRLFLQSNAVVAELPLGLASHKGDNEILRVALGLQAAHKGAREVVLLSKDINLRIKAVAVGMPTEDYRTDNVVEDADFLYTGMLELAPDFWENNEIIDSGKRAGISFYTIKGPGCEALLPNQILHGEGNDGPFLARVITIHGDQARLETLVDYEHEKNKVWGITARNFEQSVALNLLLDDNVDLVSILGQAGSGKTLLTLAAGLAQTMETKKYSEIIFTRITVPVGEDIGFLPGTEEEKMMPWMGALEDNLEALGATAQQGAGDWGKLASKDVIMSKIKVKSVTFMRGRTFMQKLLVIDEAQNLTPKQMKTLITRAGHGTKVVCLGNVAQIDAAYLTENSCGLSYLVERMKGCPNYGHVTLAKVERSRLADQAAARL